MSQTQVALLLVTAMVLGMAGLLWRNGAISGMVALMAATATFIAALFLFLTQ